jgi:H+/Cl- antiporter ClcA
LHLPVAAAALCAMAAVFAGASHAVLASAVFIAEACGCPAIAGMALLACAVSWIVATRLAGRSIMVEKIARRGITLPGHHGDPLGREDEAVEPARFRLWRSP